MIIIFHKKTGKIIASFPGIYKLPDEFTVTSGEESPEMFDRFMIGPNESLDFENPRNPKNIHDYKVIIKKGKPTGLKLA